MNQELERDHTIKIAILQQEIIFLKSDIKHLEKIYDELKSLIYKK